MRKEKAADAAFVENVMLLIFYVELVVERVGKPGKINDQNGHCHAVEHTFRKQ